MISSLVLRNFKAFRHLRLKLAPLTVLAGMNSSGKSTVIQAIALVRQSFGDTLTKEHSSFVLNGALVNLGNARDARHEDWDAKDAVGGRLFVELRTVGAFFKCQGEYEAESDVMKGEVDSSDNEPLRRLGIVGPNFQYLNADRLGPSNSYPRQYDETVRRRFLGVRGENTVNFLREFQDEPLVGLQLMHPEESSEQLLRQVEAWLGEISPETTLELANYEGLDSVRLGFRSARAGLTSSNTYRPTNVGFGLSFVLPIIVACLSSTPKSLLLIENPETHLHPRAQSVIGRLLAVTASSGAQVIVETHSEHIVNAIRIAVKREMLPARNVAIHFFARKAGAPVLASPRVSGSGRLSDWPDGFFDESDRALMELLD